MNIEGGNEPEVTHGELEEWERRLSEAMNERNIPVVPIRSERTDSVRELLFFHVDRTWSYLKSESNDDDSYINFILNESPTIKPISREEAIAFFALAQSDSYTRQRAQALTRDAVSAMDKAFRMVKQAPFLPTDAYMEPDKVTELQKRYVRFSLHEDTLNQLVETIYQDYKNILRQEMIVRNIPFVSVCSGQVDERQKTLRFYGNNWDMDTDDADTMPPYGLNESWVRFSEKEDGESYLFVERGGNCGLVDLIRLFASMTHESYKEKEEIINKEKSYLKRIYITQETIDDIQQYIYSQTGRFLDQAVIVGDSEIVTEEHFDAIERSIVAPLEKARSQYLIDKSPVIRTEILGAMNGAITWVKSQENTSVLPTL